MNAVTHLLRNSQPLNAEQAVEQANLWTVTARPIVKALFLLEDAEAEVRHGCDSRTWDEARPILSAPQRELREMLEGLRENAICDVLPRHPDAETGTDAKWDAMEAFDEQVRREVTSVDALIKRMVAEANLTVVRDGEWAA